MVKDFLWHKVSEAEKEEIKKEAKRILDNFSAALEKAEEAVKEGKEGKVIREFQTRKEEEKKESEEERKEFRKLFFKNAPHEKNFVKSEKGKWK